MTDEQSELFNKLTPLQKEISLNSISGMNDIDAYKSSKGKAKTELSMKVSVSQILSNLNVSSFIASMAHNTVNNAIMCRNEMLEDLTTIARVTTSNADNLTLETITDSKGGFDVALKAMKQLAELAGYDAPSKTDLTSSDESVGRTLADFYKDIIVVGE